MDIRHAGAIEPSYPLLPQTWMGVELWTLTGADLCQYKEKEFTRVFGEYGPTFFKAFKKLKRKKQAVESDDEGAVLLH